jgi:hypothetical protein
MSHQQFYETVQREQEYLEMKNIASALVKAQKAFGPALKTSTNPHFRSKYADLSACVEAVIDSLNNAGIALVQQLHECDNGVIVETVFIHESGETLSTGKLHVPAAKQDPQGYGSALTYARRYSLMAACGIAPEDDDGNASSKKEQAPKHSPTSGAIIDPARVDLLKQVASNIVALGDSDDIAGAYEEYSTITDAEEKTFLWKELGAWSKLRAAIKAYGQSLNEGK